MKLFEVSLPGGALSRYCRIKRVRMNCGQREMHERNPELWRT